MIVHSPYRPTPATDRIAAGLADLGYVKRRKPSIGVRFHHRPTVAVVEARPELADVSMAARVRDVLGGAA